MKLFLNCLAACGGAFLYAYITDGSYLDALNNAYFTVGGGIFVYFSHGCHKKRSTKKSPRIHYK